MLERAVNSCLQQSSDKFEVIIVDDGSTDETQTLLTDFERTDDRVRVIRFPGSKGACVARNVAVQRAKGDWITGLDDDDYFLPHRLEDFIGFDSEQYGFVCTNALELNELGAFPTRKTKTVISFDDIKRRNYVGNQIFVKKERLLAVGGYDEAAPAWQDYDLWFRLIRKFGNAYKIYNNSMVLNTLERGASITANRAEAGYRYFVSKHKEDLSARDLDFQWINDAVNRKRDISWVDVLRKSRNIESFVRLSTRSLMRYGFVKKTLFAWYSWVK